MLICLPRVSVVWEKDGIGWGWQLFWSSQNFWPRDLNRGKEETCPPSSGTHMYRPAVQCFGEPSPQHKKHRDRHGGASCTHGLQEEAWCPAVARKVAELLGWTWSGYMQFLNDGILNGKRNSGHSFGLVCQGWLRFPLGVLQGMGSEAEAWHTSRLYSFWRPLSFLTKPLPLEFAHGWQWAAAPQFLFANTNAQLLTCVSRIKVDLHCLCSFSKISLWEIIIILIPATEACCKD